MSKLNGAIALTLIASVLLFVFHHSKSSVKLENTVANSAEIVGILPSARAARAQSSVLPSGITQTSSKSDLTQAWKQSTVRMKYLRQCLKSYDCGFSKAEAWTYDAENNAAIAVELRTFTALAQLWTEQNNGRFPKEAVGVAHYFLSVGNDEVKDAALDLIALAPPSQSNMRAVINALESSVNAPLYQHGLRELVQYVKSDNSGELQKFMLTSLSNGGLTASRETARAAHFFMTPSNLSNYVAIEHQLAPRSQVRLYLRLNREEFVRMQRAGG